MTKSDSFLKAGCFLFLFFFPYLLKMEVKAQNIQWKYHLDKTYVFQISDKEAEKLLQSHPKDSLILKMLHTPVASFSGTWKDAPEQGHFIHARIEKNRVNYYYEPILPFRIFLFKQYGQLTLQITDKEGNITDRAKVRIKGKWRLLDTGIYFDKESKTYTIDDWSENTKRLLTVELDKFKAVFDLSKHLVNPWSGGNDGYSPLPQFYSYMITDKNKYKPGETVRFKSYALSQNKKPLKKELEVWINTAGLYHASYKKITSVMPYHPGGFAGEFELHDSLKLQLDKSYPIQLRDKQGKIVANTSFKYEDYELYDNKLEVKIKTNTHFYPDTNQIEIKVTDANGLFLQDVKADILIKRQNVLNSYTDLLIVPDTFLFKKIELDNMAPTLLDIPPHFPGKSDCTYNITVTVLTLDNQRMVSNHTVTFYKSHFKLDYLTRNDTIRFEFRELGKEKKVKAQLKYNNETKEVELPYEMPFIQSVTGYSFYIPDHSYSGYISAGNINPKLGVTGGIVKDSFNITLVNPLNLEVSWYIYQGNRLLQKGSGKEFDFMYPNTDTEVTHYVEIFYFMGEEEHVFRRTFVPKKEYLSIDIDLPDRVYPGMKTDITVSIKDYWGSPVKNADVTAFAVNSLLNYPVPDLPYYGTPPRAREQRSSYSIERKEYSFSMPLDYKFWNKLARLDTMIYYQFTYPWNKLFTYTVNTPDSTTQFAPYVMKDGNAMNIYVIERNSIPIWFSWTEQPKEYSFLGSDTSKQVISLRLHDRVILLDSMTFETGKKTILSLDVDHLPENARSMYIGTSFSSHEQQRYKRLISSIPVNKYEYVYLRQDSIEYPVFHSCLSQYRREPYVLAGPIPPGITQYMDSTIYKHEGGFKYQYEDNVVYKYPENVYPNYLQYIPSNNITTLNDFCLTPSYFKKKIKDCQIKRSYWNPSNIRIVQPNITLDFQLSPQKDSSGVSNLLFRDQTSNKVFFPDRIENGVRKYSSIPAATYDVILLYNSGKYLKLENIPFTAHAYTGIDLRKLDLHERDSLSEKWLALRPLPIEPEISKPTRKPFGSSSVTYTRISSSRNLVKGYVFDTAGEPLIGLTVFIKGTTIGTITDLDGYFEISLNDPVSTLVFSYIGYISKEVEVNPGTELKVTLEEYHVALEEVVVVGYGTQRKASLTGSISVVSAMKSENSVEDSQLPPETPEDTETEEEERQQAEEQLYEELMMLNGLRSNFSDVGFWEPRLYTDRKGKSRFTVTFPDNLTQWNTIVYAMNRKLKTGTLRKPVKSYKPLMAELKTPGFLVAGDSSYFAGNIRNYTKDKEIIGNISFVADGDTLLQEDIGFSSSHSNKLLVTASAEADSLSGTYLFSRNDGYKDGEKRSIPIVPAGTEIAEGMLDFLRNGDRQHIKADKDEKINVCVTGNQLDVYIDASYFLMGYQYACNEQLASKLIGLLNYKIYLQYTGEKFSYDKNVNEIIGRLLKNQNDRKLWSWWGNSSNTSFWMSAHILNALRMAKDAGYTVNLNMSSIQQDYIDTKSYRESSLYDIQILHALSEWGTRQNYEPAIMAFEKEIAERIAYEDSIYQENKSGYRTSFLKEKLLLWEIRQQQGLEYVSDSIAKYLKKDILGAVYCDDGLSRSWYSNPLTTTLIAYRIIKRDSALQKMKEPMQMYILKSKQNGWNTYQASSAVSTVLPDLINESIQKDQPATLVLSGKENKTVTSFPFETELVPGEQLTIEKKDGIPLIYTAYSRKRVHQAQPGEAFEISSELEGGDTLTAGNPIRLTVTVKVKQKNAEHVMIEVPIPAGCSYASKGRSGYYYNETHREHFKEKTVIFCESLPEGTYHFTIQLLPRYTGRYILNPAKVEMMYFPTIHATNDQRKVSCLSSD